MQNYLAKYPIIPALSKMLADFELGEDSEHRKRVRENRNQPPARTPAEGFA